MADSRPEADLQVVLSDICICCGRSKTHGTFFSIILSPGHLRHEKWSAEVEVFRLAAERGCRRCRFVFEAVVAHGKGTVQSNCEEILVFSRSIEMRADIEIKLFLQDHGELLLELLTPLRSTLMFPKFPWSIKTKPLPCHDPTSPEALKVAKVWIDECLSSHVYCNTGSKVPLPKRVLELSDSVVLLREGVQPEFQRYACLSHCWGPQGPSIQLNHKTSAMLKQGISIDSLPKTFSEAVKVCLGLGLSYLWIDALCIYQDNLVDWEQNAADMADIYEHSWITIAATSSRNSDDGLRHQVHNRFQARLIPSTGLYVREQYQEFTSEILMDKTLSPLLCRAWVFQERQLSPRMLHFGICGLVWECHSAQFTENDDTSAKTWVYDDATKDLRYFDKSGPDLVTAWHNTIEKYSALRLTYDSDKLPAIGALASKMSLLREQDTYLCGLWRSSLLADLQWRVGGLFPCGRCKSNAPTWSWASVGGRIEHIRALTPVYHLLSVTLLDVVHGPIGPVFMGKSAHARIRLRGCFSKIARQKPIQIIPRDWFRLDDPNSSALQFWTWPDFDQDTDPVSGVFEEELILLYLSPDTHHLAGYQGLVLRRLSDGHFERIGWMLVLPRDMSLDNLRPDLWAVLDTYMATLPKKTVTIV